MIFLNDCITFAIQCKVSDDKLANHKKCKYEQIERFIHMLQEEEVLSCSNILIKKWEGGLIIYVCECVCVCSIYTNGLLYCLLLIN